MGSGHVTVPIRVDRTRRPGNGPEFLHPTRSDVGVRVTVAAVSGQRTSTIVHVLRPAPSPTERSPRPSGMTRRLWQFGNREQHGGVLQGMQGVRCLGNDQQITVAPLPRHPISDQPHPTM